MKLKDLNVRDMLVIKYLACKFIIEQFKENQFLDEIIGKAAKERLVEKHSIQNSSAKTFTDVINEVTKGQSQEEKESLVSTTYDYVVNKIFGLTNADEEDPDEYFPESLIIRPKSHYIAGELKSRFGSIDMRVMPRVYFKQVADNVDLRLRATMFASANESGNEFAIVMV